MDTPDVLYLRVGGALRRPFREADPTTLGERQVGPLRKTRRRSTSRHHTRCARASLGAGRFWRARGRLCVEAPGGLPPPGALNPREVFQTLAVCCWPAT